MSQDKLLRILAPGLCRNSHKASRKVLKNSQKTPLFLNKFGTAGAVEEINRRLKRAGSDLQNIFCRHEHTSKSFRGEKQNESQKQSWKWGMVHWMQQQPRGQRQTDRSQCDVHTSLWVLWASSKWCRAVHKNCSEKHRIELASSARRDSHKATRDQSQVSWPATRRAVILWLCSNTTWEKRKKVWPEEKCEYLQNEKRKHGGSQGKVAGLEEHYNFGIHEYTRTCTSAEILLN